MTIRDVEGLFVCTKTNKAGNKMERTYATMNEEARRIVARLDELCAGMPENEFDARRRRRPSPVLCGGPQR